MRLKLYVLCLSPLRATNVCVCVCEGACGCFVLGAAATISRVICLVLLQYVVGFG